MRGDILGIGMSQDDVLVPVVVLGSKPNVGPLPTEKTDEVGILRIAGDLIALLDRVNCFSPIALGNLLGMIIDGPEVEG